MKGFVYILQTNDLKYYVGSTKNIENRLYEHNIWEVKSTKNKRPVILIKYREYDTLQEARRKEYVLKKLRNKKYIEKFIQEWL